VKKGRNERRRKGGRKEGRKRKSYIKEGELCEKKKEQRKKELVVGDSPTQRL
jgi:hypothetical protein